MKIIIEINTDNAAFNDCGERSLTNEVCRILDDLSYKINWDEFVQEKIIMDINGNNCGKLTIKD